MSPHAPPHLQHIAPNLLAGENVIYMSKPSLPVLLMLEGIIAAGAFVVLWLFMSIFSDLPNAMKAGCSVLAAMAGVGILHGTLGVRQYVITDQRLLVIAGFTHEVHDSCELDEITAFRIPRFTKSLIVERNSGKPIRLWALSDPLAVQDLLNQPEQ